MDERNDLARLTEREKECLRRWLKHETAKEIALELGISHYAVEKRLKMARTKLDVSSSLDAARLLAQEEREEGYGQAAAQSPDLVSDEPNGKKWPVKPAMFGAIVMSLLAATVILFGVVPMNMGGVAPLNAGGVAQLQRGGVGETGPDGRPIVWNDYDESEMVEATPAEILVIVQTTFHLLDKDHSGFIDGTETPTHAPEGGSPVYRRDANGNAVPTGEVTYPTEKELRANFYAQADLDGDGKVALHEYRRWASPALAKHGIPAEWKADMNKPIEADPG
jgi:DNA-binding CsgD family transcriptional regulator